jgi:predicted acetyltransferase
LRLAPIRRDHANALRAVAEEFRFEGDPRYDLLLDDPDGYFARVERFERGVDLGPDRVPMSSFVLFADDRLVGASRLRHRLIPVLKKDGGNIGYEIRATERGQGYGKRLLALTLERARARGLDRALLTAAAGNPSSLRVIEANAGIADGEAISPTTGERMLRFWIDLRG